jgi:hypothetical protein
MRRLAVALLVLTVPLVLAVSILTGLLVSRSVPAWWWCRFMTPCTLPS